MSQAADRDHACEGLPRLAGIHRAIHAARIEPGRLALFLGLIGAVTQALDDLSQAIGELR
jgi:hypothetical protein